MTVSSLFDDMIIIALFMLAGFFIREIIKPVQKLFLPSSLIGGLLALILGQQVLGVVEIPESFSSFSNVLIAPIMAALLFGVTLNRKKIVGFLDYICVEQAIYGMQMCLGAGLGALKFLLLVSLLICVVEFIDSDNTMIDRTMKEESVLYYPIESFAGMFFPAAKEVTEQYILNT